MTTVAANEAGTTATTVDPRLERGRMLSRDKRIRHIAGSAWACPSASGESAYIVDVSAERCTCPDHETRRVRCKHIRAVEIVRMTAISADGTRVETGFLRTARARAIVRAVTHFEEPKVLVEVSKGLGEPMVGIDINTMPAHERLAGRGI